jgi:hypothetical protein
MNIDQLLIGPVSVNFNGVDLGYTTDDGVKFKEDFASVKFSPAQALGVVDSHRTKVDCTVSVTFNELTLANLKILSDLADAPSGGVLEGKYQRRPTKAQLILTGPGVDGGTRTFVATASILTSGEMAQNNKEYSGKPVEFQLYENASTGVYWTLTETASSESVPAASSFQYISGGSPTTFTDGSSSVADDSTALQITFNVAIRPDMLNSGRFILKTAAGNSDVSCTIAYGTTGGETDMTKVVLTPASALASSTAYDLIVSKGLTSVDGVPTTGAIAVQFTTTA